MNSVLLEAAIRARLTQSAAAVSVSIQGVWSVVAPKGTELKVGSAPYIMMDLLTGLPSDTFDYNGIDCTYRVYVYEHKDTPTLTGATLYGAVVGNGKPNTPPTRGLHRWDATVSGMTVSQCQLIRFGYGHADDILVYWADFQIYAQEA